MDILTQIILIGLTIAMIFTLIVLGRVTYTLWKALKPKGDK